MKKLISLLIVLAILPICGALAVYDDAPLYFDVSDDGSPEDFAVFDEEDVPVSAAGELIISAPSAILIEKETGTVIFEKDADTKREPASVTKVMTILLIVEEIRAGTLKMDDIVTTSAFAASLGGSQIFLEEGEQMSVRDMLKSIVVSSANDAAVAMAEHISGSEAVFVARMNERALELGMYNTHFTNSTGLLDDVTHVTTARDIAIMSRELIRHDMIKEFTMIWMDTVRGGEFGLSNTNKLIRFFEGATGLKTGFTQRSMYCLAATAERGGVEYIAVVMHAETSAGRFESAKTLLNFAFANYVTVAAQPDEALLPVRVSLGKADTVQPVINGQARLLIEKRELAGITKSVEVLEEVKAPVKAGDELGQLTIYGNDGVLGQYPIVAGDDVEKLGWGDVFSSLLKLMFTGEN